MISATKKVVKALEESGVGEMLESIMERPEPDYDRNGFLDKYATLLRHYERFGETEKRLISMLDLDILYESDFWASLMTTKELRSGNVYAVLQSERFFRNHMPKLLSLLSREGDQVPEPKKKGQQAMQDSVARLSITIIEECQPSSPERLVLALESIDGLYRACAQFLNESEADLCVVACDSGSDKSFDFLGVAKIVECVKQVILSFWDKVVYFREDKTARRMELVAQSLPILDQVAEMKKAGNLEPERAELIRRQVIESVTKFGNAGVTIPEIENFTVYNPRQLMKPEPKLLVGPKQAEPEAGKGEEESNGASPPQIDDPEFQAYMQKMAREFLERKTQSTDASTPERAEDETDQTIDSDKN